MSMLRHSRFVNVIECFYRTNKMQKLGEQDKQIEALTVALGLTQKDNVDLQKQKRVASLSELENKNSDLLQANSTLLARVGDLTSELEVAKNDCGCMKVEANNLEKKLAKLEMEVQNLETENNDLVSAHADSKKSMQDLQIVKSENLKLKANVDELRAKGNALAVGNLPSSGDEKTALEAKISELEGKKTSLETALQEWTDLAKVSRCNATISRMLFLS